MMMQFIQPLKQSVVNSVRGQSVKVGCTVHLVCWPDG